MTVTYKTWVFFDITEVAEREDFERRIAEHDNVWIKTESTSGTTYVNTLYVTMEKKDGSTDTGINDNAADV